MHDINDDASMANMRAVGEVDVSGSFSSFAGGSIEVYPPVYVEHDRGAAPHMYQQHPLDVEFY